MINFASRARVLLEINPFLRKKNLTLSPSAILFLAVVSLLWVQFFFFSKAFFVAIQQAQLKVFCLVALFCCFYRGFFLNQSAARRLRDRRTEKRQVDLIASSISDGILFMKNDEILYANPVAEKILNLSAGRSSAGIKLRRDAQALEGSGADAILRSLASSLPIDFVLEGSGRKLHYLIRSCPVSLGVEQVGMNGHRDDERRVDDEAHQMILAQDVTLMRESEQAKSHFLGTLSHEVKTPVTSLTLAIHLLKKSLENSPNLNERTLIATCAEDIDRLRILLDELLKVSQFDILSQRLELKKIDLGKLIIHAVQSFRMQAIQKEIDLTYSIKIFSEVPTSQAKVLIQVDAAKISWALSNLLSNALRHSPKGGKIEVSLDRDLQWAKVSVKDTGPGVAHHRQARLFDKFTPDYDLRVSRAGSVGAGLAIAREIVVAHGGEIAVISEPGEGAEFVFRLPLKEVENGLVA